VLTGLDEAMRDLTIGSLVTAIVAKVEQTPSEAAVGLRTFRWSNAGRPPPLLINPHGVAGVPARDVDLLLGVVPERPRRDHTQTLEPGSAVVLYTDGLVERRGSSLDDGTELLRTTATRLASAGLALDPLCDTLLAELGGAFDDDVALLAVRAHPED
jgi:serine phosphatase RsbU (regulator of sigma subunit)